MKSFDPRFFNIPAKGASALIEEADIVITFYGKRGGGRVEHLTREAAEDMLAKLTAALSPEAAFPVTIELAGPNDGPPCLWAQPDGTFGAGRTAKRFPTVEDADRFLAQHPTPGALVIA